MGVNGLAYRDILSFFELMNYRPLPWELEMIEAFDNVYLEHIGKKMEAENRKAKSRAKPSK